MPKKIAVITSNTGAAVKDILNITKRRFPLTEIVMCPVNVQGELAVGEMIDALDRVYALSDIDTIIIGRGGGSAEDLNAFNDENLARKIYESPIPVISAVGHETDFTICDFVSDLRAPTPSAAAELAVPDMQEISAFISKCKNSLVKSMNIKLSLSASRLKNASVDPKRYEIFIDNRAMILDSLSQKLSVNVNRRVSAYCDRVSQLAVRLDALSPLKVLSRGYAVAQKDGNIVRCLDDVTAGDTLDLRFCDGTAHCKVLNTEKDR